MEVLYTMYLIGGIHCEWNAVQTLPAHDAGETLGVVRFACRTQNLWMEEK